MLELLHANKPVNVCPACGKPARVAYKGAERLFVCVNGHVWDGAGVVTMTSTHIADKFKEETRDK